MVLRLCVQAPEHPYVPHTLSAKARPQHKACLYRSCNGRLTHTTSTAHAARNSPWRAPVGASASRSGSVQSVPHSVLASEDASSNICDGVIHTPR